MALTEDGEVYTWGHNASGQVKKNKHAWYCSLLSVVSLLVKKVSTAFDSVIFQHG